MKRLLLVALCFVFVSFSFAQITETFGYTGAVQTWVVPFGVTSIDVDAQGAQGGDGTLGGGAVGGAGGRVQATLDVTPGTTLYIYIGGEGDNIVTGGFNGGGNGTSASFNGGGGGGATDIRIGGTALSNRVLVAGGGGGALQGNGGAGGGLVGGQGSTVGGGVWATGGTQSAGGNGGLYNTGFCAPGTWAFNGALGGGGNGINGVGSCTNYGGSGGGGGYYGGGGMQINGAGGGSSYTDPVIATNVIHTQGFQTGHGEVIITYQAYTNSETFNYTGGMQTWVVPPGVTSIFVESYGAQGGDGGPLTPGGNGVGGGGGLVQATLDVTPGETLYLFVGGQGQSAGLNAVGGYNGGGNTSATCNGNRSPGAGGGASDIRIGGTALVNRVVVAGGGGGSGGWQTTNGGGGGGLIGQDGQPPYWGSNIYGSGGTQSAGGAGGNQAGSLGQGGNGSGGCHGGGGGGGGYYGGGGALIDAGGGGSSYTDPGIASNVVHVQGTRNGNGLINISYDQVCELPSITTPFIVNSSDRLHTLTTVNVGGSGSNVAYVDPGQSVSLSFTYNIVAGGAGCPGCVTQTYVGIKDFWGSCVSSYGGYCNCTNGFSTTFTAPTTPGVYYFTLGTSWNFSCGVPNLYLPNPNGSNEFAAIVVRESWTPTITNETCVGDMDGALSVTANGGTVGTSYLWNTGATTPSISGLSAGTYTVTSTDSYGCFQTDTLTVATDTTVPSVFAESALSISLDGAGNASVAVAAIDSASSDACPLTLEIGSFDMNGQEANYRFLGNYNGHAYFLSKNISNFATAQANATIAGGYLATINDAAENAVLQEWIEGSFPFIGLNDIALEGTFVWDNGEPTSFFNWSGSEPNNTGGIEDCSQIYYTTGLWNDIPCANQYLSILEFNSPVPFATSIAFNCADTGNNIVVLRGTDQGGLVTYDTTIVTVSDNSPPAVATQNVTIFLDSNGMATISSDTVVTGGSDNCQLDTTYLSQTDFTCADVGANTVTVFAEDVSGNVSSVTVTVTVQDNIAPSALGQNLTVYLDINGVASTTAAAVNNGSNDACGIASLALDDSLFNCSDVGAPVPVVLTVADNNGNTDTAQVSITVLDTVRPTLAVNNSFVYLDSSGSISISPSLVDAGTFDACGIATLTLDSFNFDCDRHGDTITALFTAIDINGNSKSTSVDLYILDTIAPEVITQDITVYLDSFGDATITAAMIDNGSWDSCGIATSVLDIISFNCGDVGANTVTLTLTDIHGNVQSNTAIVDVLDTIAPHIVATNITVELDSFGAANITPASINSGTWDSCGIASLVIDTGNLSCANVGVPLTVNLTATDVNGNMSTGAVTVTVEDNIAPTILTQNITAFLDSNGNVSVTPSLFDLGTWDSCGINTLSLSQTSFTCADSGVNTIEFIAEDIHSNADTQLVQVTVLDTQPAVVLTQNLTLYLDINGGASITVNDVDVGSFDNCAISQRWLSQSAFNCADTAAVQTIWLYVQDVSGNIDSAFSDITIIDTTSPNMVAQDIDVYLDSMGMASIVPGDIDNGSSDNCSIDTLWLDQYDFDCSLAWSSTTVTLFAKDVSGNTKSITAIVSVFDTIAPKPVVQNITIALDSQGQASILPDTFNVNTWDSCGVDFFELNDSSFSCANVGTNVLTFYATDIHGNTDSINVTLTVEDTIAPAIDIQDLMIYLDSNGLASVTPDSVDIGTWDGCGIATLTLDTSSFDCANHGDTLTVLFTATDIHGNVSTDSSTFIILDTLPPVLYVHADTFYLDSTGQFVVTPSMLNDSTMDNCGVDSLYLSDTLFDCGVVAQTFDITFFARDIYGNIDSTLVSITILDSIHPIITCNDSLIVPNDTGQCGAIVGFPFPTAWENCSVDSIYQVDVTGLDSGSFFPVGFTTLTYVAIDQSGNTDTCSFVIEVQDVEAPELFCVPDTLICDSVFTFDLPAYADNCSGFDVVQIAGISSGEFYPVGNTTNQFTVTDSYGNSDTCSFDVFRYDFPSKADADDDIEQCEAFESMLAGNDPIVGIGTWSRISGSGDIVDSLDNGTLVQNITPGISLFEWRIEEGVCPVERDTMQIHEYLNPGFVNAGELQVLCDTFEATLAPVSDTIGFGSWLTPSNGATIADTSVAAALVEGLELGTYTFTWKVVNGVCPILYDDVEIQVVPYPVISSEKDTTYIFSPSTAELQVASTLPVTYNWSPEFTVTNVADSIVVVDPSSTTTYVARGVTEEGCAHSTEITVVVNEALDIPTAFTPDGDGFNDVWNIKELENYPNCEVKIYNRWGHLILESEGYPAPWDGTFQSEQLPSGSYFFVINLGPGQIEPLTGSITIIK